MRKKLTNKMRLTRPSDVFLPLALLLGCLFGRQNGAIFLFMSIFLIKLLSLSASDSLRIAFATQPSMRDVRGSVASALICNGIGSIIALLLLYLIGNHFFQCGLGFILTGFFLNIEHVFYEYLFATGDRRSAALSRLLTSIFLLTGMLLSDDSNLGIWHPLNYMAFAAAIVSCIVGLALGGWPRGRLNARIIICAPRAMLQTFLYPFLTLAASALIEGKFPPNFELQPLIFNFSAELPGFLPIGLCAGFFAGWMLVSVCRTPFRRSSMESRNMNVILLILIISAALILGFIHLPGLSLPVSPQYDVNSAVSQISILCGMLILAALCAFALYGCVSPRDE